MALKQVLKSAPFFLNIYKGVTHMYSDSTMELAQEMAQHLGSDDEDDIEFIAEWLTQGADDGSPATELVSRFESTQDLPSKTPPKLAQFAAVLSRMHQALGEQPAGDTANDQLPAR
jgi:hypothetical protein